MSDVPECSIARLSVRPGDCVVIKCKAPLPMPHVEHLLGMLKAKLPEGVSAFVLDRDFDLAVITREQIDQQPQASDHQS